MEWIWVKENEGSSPKNADLLCQSSNCFQNVSVLDEMQNLFLPLSNSVSSEAGKKYLTVQGQLKVHYYVYFVQNTLIWKQPGSTQFCLRQEKYPRPVQNPKMSFCGGKPKNIGKPSNLCNKCLCHTNININTTDWFRLCLLVHGLTIFSMLLS